MFNVIRIPTKFSKTIRRLSKEDKLKLFDALMEIWDGKEISPPDSFLWDTISLIYGEWMNMESRNGNKPKHSLIDARSEWVGTESPSDSVHRVEYSRVEESIVNDSDFQKFWNIYDKKVDSSKCKKKWNLLKQSDIDTILLTVDKYIISNPDKKYRKNPLTYLNWECWNDEIIVTETKEEKEDREYRESDELLRRKSEAYFKSLQNER